MHFKTENVLSALFYAAFFVAAPIAVIIIAGKNHVKEHEPTLEEQYPDPHLGI